MNLVGFQLGSTRLNLLDQLKNTTQVNLVENPNSKIQNLTTWLEIQNQKYHFIRVQLGSTRVRTGLKLTCKRKIVTTSTWLKFSTLNHWIFQLGWKTQLESIPKANQVHPLVVMDTAQVSSSFSSRQPNQPWNHSIFEQKSKNLNN